MWIFFRATEKNFGPLFCVITSTVELRYNKGANDWQNLFAISRFLFLYFTVTVVKKVVRYTEDFVM